MNNIASVGKMRQVEHQYNAIKSQKNNSADTIFVPSYLLIS